MHGPMGESSYTKVVNTLVKQINDNTHVKDSLFEHAAAYFEHAADNKQRIESLRDKVKSAEAAVASSAKKDQGKAEETLAAAQKALRAENTKQEKARLSRLAGVEKVCVSILKHTEGNNWTETQVDSAKMLGTLLMLSPAEGAKLARLHQRLKPLYKAVLSMRLLDKLLLDKQITNKYVLSKYQDSPRYREPEDDITMFQRDVGIPLLTAALFQDVGMQHPDAQNILIGPNGNLDEFRTLEKSERVELLKINHEQTLDFITYGLGPAKYIGNSKEERETFDQNEKNRLIFLRTLLNDAVKPKLGVGNLLKVPQIYGSVIFSTKASYNYKDLPKAGIVLEKAAEQEAISPIAAKAMVQITGHFPQGYGITYIPKDEDKNDLDRYEYAIVNGLNPKHSHIPQCRIATRNLTFNSFGHNVLVSTDNNLYYPAAREKLEKFSEARLKEILSMLWSNYDERKDLDLIPWGWQPYVYFAYTRFQNLWNKNNTLSN